MARDRDDAVRITSAAESRDADIRVRQKRYLLSMSLRSICFVGALLVGDGWLRWVLVGGAIILPYIAVVMANAVTTRADDFVFPGAVHQRPQLQGAPVAPDATQDRS